MPRTGASYSASADARDDIDRSRQAAFHVACSDSNASCWQPKACMLSAGALHGKPPFPRGFLNKPPSRALQQPRSPPFVAQTGVSGGTEAVLTGVVERFPANQRSSSIDKAAQASLGRKDFQRNQERAGNMPEEPKKMSRFKQQVTTRFQA